MPKKVVEDVNPTYGTLSGNVSKINQTYTTVAEVSDINSATSNLNERIDTIRQNLKKEISSLETRIDEMEDLPDEIRNVMESTTEEQASMLRKLYQDIANGLAGQQRALNKTCEEAKAHIQTLSKKYQEAQAIYSKIAQYADVRNDILSLNRKIRRTRWLCAVLAVTLVSLFFFLTL